MDGLNYAAIGSRIKTARKKQNLSQEQVAERYDITSSFDGNIGRGNKKAIIETLVQISKAGRNPNAVPTNLGYTEKTESHKILAL